MLKKIICPLELTKGLVLKLLKKPPTHRFRITINTRLDVRPSGDKCLVISPLELIIYIFSLSKRV